MADEGSPLLALAVDARKGVQIPGTYPQGQPSGRRQDAGGTQGLGTRSIHTPYNPSTPVIIRTVAENMACHAGTTRTKKADGHGMGH